jgi:hypothetical protein
MIHRLNFPRLVAGRIAEVEAMILDGVTLHLGYAFETHAQPQSFAVVAGSNLTVNVTVTGSPAPGLQWQFNGINLSGANLDSLTLNNMSVTQSGSYTVVVTNSFGSVTSAVARLTAVIINKQWTGAGDGQSWSDVDNWSGSTLPASTDSIYIGGSGTISNVPSGLTLNNLICQQALSITGSLTVNGAVNVASNLYLAPRISIVANGTNSAFIGEGSIIANQVSMYVQQGGLISLPALTNYLNGDTGNCILQASGAGSVLDLPALQQITGPYYLCSDLTLQALSGARLNLKNVNMMSCSYVNPVGGNDCGGGIRVFADGTNSVVDLTGLQQFTGTSGGTSSGSQMQPSNGGQIMVPNLGYTIGLSLYVSGGMTFSLPALTNYLNGDSGNCTLQSSGVGSVLNLPALQQITGPYYLCSVLNLQAAQGALLNIKNVNMMSCSYVNPVGGNGCGGGIVVSADGTNSVIDLTNLRMFTDNNNGGTQYPSYMRPSNGGQILVPNLGYAMGLSLYVAGGMTFSLPALTNYLNGNVDNCILQASGTGSVLDLPALQQIAGPYYLCSDLTLQALQGARLNLKNVNLMYCSFVNPVGGNDCGGGINVDASGTNSVIDLTGLVTFNGLGNISQENDGAVLLNTNTIYGNVSIQLAPAVLSAPQSLFTVSSGLTVLYSIAVSASAPAYYQWYSNNIPIAGGTNSTLIFNNVQPSWSGNGYSVVVSNVYGSATSPVAILTVPTESIMTTVTGNGSIEISPTAANYFLGQTFTLTAVPGNYSAFVGWSDSNPNNPRNIVVNTSNYYIAIFTNTSPAVNIVQVGGQSVVLYPMSGSNCVLMTTTNLLTGPWVPATNGVSLIAITFSNVPPGAFFRLQCQ